MGGPTVEDRSGVKVAEEVEKIEQRIVQEASGPTEHDDFGLPPARRLRAPTLPVEATAPSNALHPGQTFVEASKVSEDNDAAAPAKFTGVDNSTEGSVAITATSPVSADKGGNDSISKDAGHAPATRVSLEQSPKQQRQSTGHVSEWSHQQLAPHSAVEEEDLNEVGEWQEMPAYARYDIYNDDDKLIARETTDVDEDELKYGALGGAGKGYTRVQMDEDAQSATSMDDNTAYLFRERGTNLQDEDDDARNAVDQLQATKNLLTEGQRIAYVGIVRLCIIEMAKSLDQLERTKGAKKILDNATESLKLWSQQMMVRVYAHMEVESAEQMMIEQLAEHGVQPDDLAPALKQNARVQNPKRNSFSSRHSPRASPRPPPYSPRSASPSKSGPPSPGKGSTLSLPQTSQSLPLVNGEDQGNEDALASVKTPSELPDTSDIDIDLRWTVLCDLFLVLISSSDYDARSRRLLELVGGYLDVPWLDICRFEKRVTDALEMQEEAAKENWNEEGHMETRRNMARNRRLVLMGLATVGGGLVIGLSAGLLAPVIGAGLAAGFTTIGVAGTGTFLAGAGGAAIITTTGVLSGGSIAVKAAGRRTGAVKTFEYRPLHNNKRVHLIVTVSGWMTGKVDDVRLPFSTVDPIMGDIYSVFWEPDMLQSMGQTISILATEALTQGLQQVLGSTILIALMAALQLPVVLTKLAYLIDNPWSVSVARADAAGLILADSLIDRNLGARPITLVGFSLGSRLIFSCLRELAEKGRTDLVQNVYLFGTPVIAKKDEYIKARTAVSGRFVNGYATNDWILGYLFRATGGGVMRVAGLAAVDVPGVENFNVSEIVPGHMSYRGVMPKLLREVGWSVESDEFTEIEDPDPENHGKRQRELIDEIEEARRQLQAKPQKKRFGFWGRKKADKKEWEIYDEKSNQPTAKTDIGDLDGKDILFDVDAIRKEVAQLSAEGIEVRELKTTLPPMKLDISSPPRPVDMPELRSTKSYNDSIPSSPLSSAARSSIETAPTKKSIELPQSPLRESQTVDEPDISMIFNTAFEKPLPISSHVNKASHATTDVSADTIMNLPVRPSLESRHTMPSSASIVPVAQAPINLEHNAWADDDEFGNSHGEVSMTFE